MRSAGIRSDLQNREQVLGSQDSGFRCLRVFICKPGPMRNLLLFNNVVYLSIKLVIVCFFYLLIFFCQIGFGSISMFVLHSFHNSFSSSQIR